MMAWFVRLSLVVAMIGEVACAWVQFELSPYAPRSVEVVYSEQEDLTFYFWRLSHEADPGRVQFELHDGAGYLLVDLSHAPFPAEPFRCGGGKQICFQYQVPGRVEPSVDVPLLRTVEDQGGIYASGPAGFEVVATTLTMEPVGILSNNFIEPQMTEWFHAGDLPLRRAYRWRFTAAAGADCGDQEATGWAPLPATLPVDHAWVEQDLCFEARPFRQDQDGVTLRARLLPSAEIFVAEQQHTPDSSTAPIQFVVLLDLRIPNAERCEYVKQAFLTELRTALASRGEVTELGTYTPVGLDGLPQDGCGQDADRRYPVTELMDRVLVEVAQYELGTVRPLLIYANNIELPLNPELTADLWTLYYGISEHTVTYTWAISSAYGMIADAVLGWQPVDSVEFVESVQLFAQQTLPFSTLEHEPDTPITIEQTDPSREPVAVKICRASPVRIAGIQTSPFAPLVTPTMGAADWDERFDGYPVFMIDLGWQVLVESSVLAVPEVTIHLEFCVRFCDNPFRSAGGVVFDNWRQPNTTFPMEACAWF